MSFVEFHDVKKIYHMGEVEIPAGFVSVRT